MEQISTDYAADLEARAESLTKFFGILFDKDDLILIVAGLDKNRHKALCADLGDWPQKIGGRKTTYFSEKLGRIQPFPFLKPFIISHASITAADLAALHQINQQGYGIFFAINPMSCGRRCQKTVTMARHILIESDKNDIDAQLRFLKKYEANIVSAVHSGGKSLHCLVRISPPRPHPGVVGAWTAFHLPKGATKAPWAEYRQMGDCWIAEAEKHGIEIDTAAAHDHSRVSRVPGFLHSKTGRRAEVFKMNPSASWDWRVSSPASGVPPVASVVQEVFREVSQNGSDSFSLSFLKPKARPSPETSKERKELLDTAKTNIVRTFMHTDSNPSSRNSFLDSIDAFENLRKNGLPGRHVRRKMHKYLFETARVFDWTKFRMAKEWARVIRKNLQATIETTKSALKDMLRAWNATDEIGIYLPDLAKLPELDKTKMGVMESRFVGMGCKEPLKAARIVARVILPLVKKLPRQCLLGTVGISSRELRNAAHIRGHSRAYKDLWRWMQSVKIKIAICKNNQFVPLGRTRKYGINIPLVLWLCGFHTDELDWGPVDRNTWPELSRMTVINDVSHGATPPDSVRTTDDIWDKMPLSRRVGRTVG